RQTGRRRGAAACVPRYITVCAAVVAIATCFAQTVGGRRPRAGRPQPGDVPNLGSVALEQPPSRVVEAFVAPEEARLHELERVGEAFEEQVPVVPPEERAL